jgi:hypothetical protein
MEKTQRNPELLNFMLLSIWELSGGTSYKEVLLKEVLHKTIKKLGLDPKKEKLQGAEGWSLKLRMLFRSYMEGVPSSNPSYVALLGYGRWALTPLGVEYLKSIFPEDILKIEQPLTIKGPNETSQWLDSNGVKLYKYLTKNLPKTLKMSATLGSIDDHIQTFFVKIITNNALKPYISLNKQISFSMLNAWAIRSAYSEFTTMGQEPVERVMRNAKTETELTLEKLNASKDSDSLDLNPLNMSSPSFGYEFRLQKSTDSDSNNMNFEADSFDFEIYDSENQEDKLLSKMSFGKNFNYIKNQISDVFSKSKDQNLALKIFDDMIFTNKNIQEIAESNATATSKVYSIISKIREESYKVYSKGQIDL